MAVSSLSGAAATAVQQRVEQTQAYQHYVDYFRTQKIQLTAPDAYRFAETDTTVVQYRLEGLDETATGVVEFTLSDGTVRRTTAIIECYDETGDLSDIRRFCLRETGSVQQVEPSTTEEST